MMSNLTVFSVRKGVKNQSNFSGNHSHNFFQFIYVLSGKGSIKLFNKLYQTKPGDIFLIPVFTDHQIFGFKNLTTIHINFLCGEQLSKRLLSLEKHCWNLGPYEISIVQDILSESITSHCFNKEIINIRLYELILRTFRATHSNSILICTNTEFIINNLASDIKSVLNYIDENIYFKLDVSQVASHFGYSGSYFSRCFKNAMGCTPGNYITLRKMDIAKKLLLTTQMNITQISEYLGFSSIHYFSRLFKLYFGVSPIKFYSTDNSEIVIKLCDKLKNKPEEFLDPSPLTLQC